MFIRGEQRSEMFTWLCVSGGSLRDVAKTPKPSTEYYQNNTWHSMPCLAKSEASFLLVEAKKPSHMVLSRLCFL